MKNNISRVHIYNVIVLNNISGDCLMATLMSISLECEVSEVFTYSRGYPGWLPDPYTAIVQHFKCLIIKVETKAMIRNRSNRIPHPALNIKWERDTYN